MISTETGTVTGTTVRTGMKTKSSACDCDGAGAGSGAFSGALAANFAMDGTENKTVAGSAAIFSALV